MKKMNYFIKAAIDASPDGADDTIEISLKKCFPRTLYHEDNYKDILIELVG